ncbi:MAG: sulfatase, partial [Candidatus Poribacteria bacterium]|nr:sulfatase [Candidatus Poribacteria bacterium]
MDPVKEYKHLMTRRHFFGKAAHGLGAAALGSLLPKSVRAAISPTEGMARIGGLPSVPHFAPKATRGIWLFTAG